MYWNDYTNKTVYKYWLLYMYLRWCWCLKVVPLHGWDGLLKVLLHTWVREMSFHYTHHLQVYAITHLLCGRPLPWNSTHFHYWRPLPVNTFSFLTPFTIKYDDHHYIPVSTWLCIPPKPWNGTCACIHPYTHALYFGWTLSTDIKFMVA